MYLIYMYFDQFIYLFIYLSIYLSICLNLSVLISLSIDLFTFVSPIHDLYVESS